MNAREFEFHEIVRKEPLTFDELAMLGLNGFALYSFEPPTHAASSWSFHLRRPNSDATLPDRKAPPRLRGGLDHRPGLRLSDLTGRYQPIRRR